MQTSKSSAVILLISINVAEHVVNRPDLFGMGNLLRVFLCSGGLLGLRPLPVVS